MNYQETIELEKNIKIKNEAEKIYKDFMNNVTLSVSKFKDGKFKTWSDSHNATYIKIVDNTFVFVCDFLHENYSVKITPECLFGYVKNKYRGLEHLKAEINGYKEKR